tara:strand:+ start:82 stop:291 length:210 start_codon:yes stop_codon:yes gene_type:complete
MATLEEVYKVLKEKRKKGEDIGMFGQSYIEMFENKDKEQPTTKEIDVSFQKNENQNTRQPTQNQIQQKK